MKYIIGNWKMNCNEEEAKNLAREIIENYKLKIRTSLHENLVFRKRKIENLEIVLCPPFTMLSTVSQIIQSSDHPIIKLGAQNCHFLPCGAFTGEISPVMLKDFCQYVIVGHSERRKYFGEDDKSVNKKIKSILENGLIPIVCVGEWKKGDSSKGIFNQLKNSTSDLKDEDFEKVIITYEPVWAISAVSGGIEADPSYVSKIIKEMKQMIPEGTPVIYGGSVDSSNISGFIKQEIIDGVLVGGASIKSKEFLKIIERVGGEDVS